MLGEDAACLQEEFGLGGGARANATGSITAACKEQDSLVGLYVL
jgi:hypothetical protein